MRMQLCTWIEVQDYLARSKGIIVPIGSCEQHGPNGLIGTDAICPETIAWAGSDRIGTLVAPTLNYGMAQHHMAFTGTVTLRPSTMIAMLEDVVHSLAHHGFERILFLNGHGGNIPIMTTAFQEIYTGVTLRGQRPVRCAVHNWWVGPKVTALAKERYGDAEGRHATPSEVSLSYYAYPDAVKQVPLDPPIAPLANYTDSLDYRRCFPDGRIGSNPGLASVADGALFLDAGIDDLAAAYAALIEAP